MSSLEAIFLGIIQGATEFLPVSSSGHLVLAQELLGWQQPDLTFDVWLHFSTLLAVIIFFNKSLRSLTKKDLKIILLASVPAAIVGFFLEDTIVSLFGSAKIVAVTLLVTGLFNLITDRTLQKKSAKVDSSKVDLKQGLVIGFFQALAIIPGISRSGSTVLAASIQGIERLESFRFSFILSLPVIFGASLLQLVKIMGRGGLGVIDSSFLLAAGAAFLTGLASLHIFQYVMKRSRLDLFGYYCLLLGGSYLLFV